MSAKTEEPENRESTGRNVDGTFQPGVSGNPGGRPKNSLKDYVARKLSEMTEEDKETWLRTVPKDLQWQMAEGRPAQESDITSGGKEINPLLVKFINDKDGTDTGGV